MRWQPARRVLVGVACLSLLAAGCTSASEVPAPVQSAAPTESADAGEVASQTALGDVKPWLAGPSPGAGSTGPTFPEVWPSARVEPASAVTSLWPVLAAPSLSGDVEYEVVDLSAGGGFGVDGAGEATQVVFTGQGPAKGIELPTSPPVLEQGASYGYRARATGGEWAGPWSFSVDLVRAGVAPTDALGGVSVNLMSGVPTTAWTSVSFPGAVGDLQFGATYRPGSPASPGLPEGWTWILPGSGFLTISESQTRAGSGADEGPLSVQLQSADGSGPTFVRTETGTYVPGLSDGKAAQYAMGGTLLRAGEGRWTYTSPDGSLTEYAGGRIAAEWLAGMPIATFTWDADGRLVALTDGVTGGRAFTLTYDGCAAGDWGEGFSAGDGLWCAVTYPNGESSQVGYVETGGAPRLALVADPGGVGQGFGWDESGRLVSLRGPAVTSAAAVDKAWADAQFATEVAYDESGRVASVTLGATEPGGPRVRRAYEYPAGGEFVARAQQLVVEGGQATPVDSAIGGGVVLQVAADESWRVQSTTSVDGLTATVSYDEKSGQATGGTTPEDRRVEIASDSEGLMEASVGPFAGDPSGAMRSERTLDVRVDDPAQGADSSYTPFQGLASIVWPKDAPGVPGFWDRTVLKDGLTASFDGPPGGSAGPWRAQATGLWRVAETDVFDFEITTSDGATASLSIDGVRCASAGSDSTCRMRLAQGEHAVLLTFDVTSGDGRGSFAVNTGGQAIEVADLRPNFNMATRIELNDRASGFDLGSTVTVSDRPWTGQPDRVATAGGRVSAYAYEGSDAAAGLFSRMTGLTTPGGSTLAMAYYQPNESATDPCTSSSYPQAGLPKQTTRYDGVRITTVYDAAGRPVAISTDGAGMSELVCATYDAAGRVVTSQVSDSARGLVEQSSITRVVSNGLLTTTTTTTLGEGSPVGAGETFTETEVTDVAGRTLSSIDASGTRAELSYSPDGALVKRLVWAPGVQGDPTISTEFAYDPQTGRPTVVTVNGRELAKVSYDGRGQVSRVAYPDGVSQSMAYGTSGGLATVEVTAGDRTFVSTRTRNPVGRTLTSDIQVSDGGKKVTSQQWEYTYDAAGRITNATLATDGDDTDTGGRKRVFGYDYGQVPDGCFAGAPANLDRSGGSRDGVAYETCRDEKGRLVWTTDPQLTGGTGKAKATYDGLGRLVDLTGVVPLRLEWSSSTQVARMSQGAAVTTLLYAAGTLHSMTHESDDSVATTVRYGYGGTASPTFILDADLRVLDARVALPGGVLAHLDPAGGKSLTLNISDASGVAFVTTVDGNVVGDTATGLAPRLGPYGEPLAAIPTSSSALSGIGPGTRYGFHAAAGNPTVTGHHDLTLTLRPYHPWLGEFLASDPVVGASTTAYGYGDGNPVDTPDYTGGFGEWDLSAVISAGIAVIAGISMGTAKAGSSKVRTIGSAVVGALAVVASVGSTLSSLAEGKDPAGTVISAMAATLGVAGFAAGASKMRGMMIKRAQEIKKAELRQVEHLADKPWRSQPSALQFSNGNGILVDPGPQVTTLSFYSPTSKLYSYTIANDASEITRIAKTRALLQAGQAKGWVPAGDTVGIEAFVWSSM